MNYSQRLKRLKYFFSNFSSFSKVNKQDSFYEYFEKIAEENDWDFSKYKDAVDALTANLPKKFFWVDVYSFEGEKVFDYLNDIENNEDAENLHYDTQDYVRWIDKVDDIYVIKILESFVLASIDKSKLNKFIEKLKKLR